MSKYIDEPRNEIRSGLYLIQINPERAVCLEKANGHYGWLLYKGPESNQWVSLRKLSDLEIEEAWDQVTDMRVLDAAPDRPGDPARSEQRVAALEEQLHFFQVQYQDEIRLNGLREQQTFLKTKLAAAQKVIERAPQDAEYALETARRYPGYVGVGDAVQKVRDTLVACEAERDDPT